MKYIIMCGGDYKHWEKPRHLSVINGEELVARTIRLLKENGIKDINISSNNPVFEKFDVPVLKHKNNYSMLWHKAEGDWFDCFYPTDEPTCYILGDVYFSEEAIETIVNTDTDDIELFGSIPPFAPNYIKNHIEAFALKVTNIKHLKDSIEETRKLGKKGKFWRNPPIIWELWEVIKGNPLQTNKEDTYIYDYTKINDYTCDIDWQEDIKKLEYFLKGGYKMFKCEVIERFTLSKFNELKNVVRKEGRNSERYGELFIGDTFECDENMAKYLTGKNDKNKVVAKIIELKPVQDEMVIPLDPERTNQLGKTIMEYIKTAPLKESNKTSKKKTSKK